MTRLYYTDPIKALYMMREFGVKIALNGYYDCGTQEWTEQQVSFSDLLDEGLHECIKKYPDKNRLYVAKESKDIFKIKARDHVFLPDYSGLDAMSTFDTISTVLRVFSLRGEEHFSCVSFKDPYISKNHKIIMRGNKQFFRPKVEND